MAKNRDLSKFPNAITVLDNGNVGIGNTSPIYPLHISASYNKTTTSGTAQMFISTNEAAASNPFGLRFQVFGGANLAARYATLQTTDYNLADGGSIVLQPGGGNVGIGTNSPSETLSINGNILLDKAISSSAYSEIRARYLNDNNCQSSIRFYNPDNGFGGEMRFYTQPNINGAANAERMRITSSGSVGIGTSAPSSNLHVYNNADVWHARFGSASGELRIGGATSSGAVIQSYTPGDSVRDLYIQRDGGKVGIGTYTPTATRLSLGTGIGAKLMIYDNPSSGVYSGIGQDLAGGNSTDFFAHSYANYGYLTFGKLGTNGSTYTEWARFDPSGNLNIKGGQIQQNGVGIVQIVPISPAATNVSYSGTINGQYTIGSSSIPSNARWVFANVFLTANISDHENFMMTRSNFGAQKNWVDTRGNNPANEFGNLTQDDSVILTYNGESDGFTPNYGIWINNVLIPSSGRNIWINNYGNSGSSGYLYFIVRGYSL